MEQNEQPRTPRLPDAFEPLQEERDRVDRIMSRLNVASDLTERADLGIELVRSMSRYEDTLERAVWPAVAERDSVVVKELEADREELREAMSVIRDATKHVDARNVHDPDPQGFEDALDDVRVLVLAILRKEDVALISVAESLSNEDRTDMSAAVSKAFHNASEKPVPPKTAIGRVVANAAVKLDRNFEDASTPQHPARETASNDDE